MKLFLNIICASMLLMQVGCMRGNMADCLSNAIFFSLQFNLEQTSNITTDLPLNRGDIYLFDENDLYVARLPITNGVYTRMVEDYVVELKQGLKQGRYRAVSWAYLATNVQEEKTPYLTDPLQFGTGETKLEQIVITSSIEESKLTKVSNPENNMPNIYTSQAMFESSGGSAKVDMNYWQVNKTISVNLSFRQKEGQSCTELTDSKVFINCSDSKLTLLGRALKEQPRFDYLPYDKTVEPSVLAVHKFKKMTLDQTNTSPTIRVVNKEGVVLYEEQLLTLLNGTGYSTQKSLDNTNLYNLEIELPCSGGGGNTNTTVNVSVNGWKYVPIVGPL